MCLCVVVTDPTDYSDQDTPAPSRSGSTASTSSTGGKLNGLPITAIVGGT